MKNLSPKIKTMWATYKFQEIALEWWNGYKIEHGIQYLKWSYFVIVFYKRLIPQIYYDRKYEEYYTLQQGYMTFESYHEKVIRLLKYVPEDKNHKKVHRFLVRIDPKIKTVVNVLSPKMLEEAYDLSKREEGNLGIKKTFINYNL